MNIQHILQGSFIINELQFIANLEAASFGFGANYLTPAVAGIKRSNFGNNVAFFEAIFSAAFADLVLLYPAVFSGFGNITVNEVFLGTAPDEPAHYTLEARIDTIGTNSTVGNGGTPALSGPVVWTTLNPITAPPFFVQTANATINAGTIIPAPQTYDQAANQTYAGLRP